MSLLTNGSYHTLSFVGNAIVWPAFLRIVALEGLFRLGVLTKKVDFANATEHHFFDFLR